MWGSRVSFQGRRCGNSALYNPLRPCTHLCVSSTTSRPLYSPVLVTPARPASVPLSSGASVPLSLRLGIAPVQACICPFILAPGDCHNAGLHLSLYPWVQAADIVQVMGIGRNEYIAMLNQCKGRRLMWRMNPRVGGTGTRGACSGTAGGPGPWGGPERRFGSSGEGLDPPGRPVLPTRVHVIASTITFSARIGVLKRPRPSVLHERSRE